MVSVHDGVLDIHDHDSMAAVLLPFCYDGSTDGPYTVRMRQARAFVGYHNAFLLSPDFGRWPQDGELDFS